MEGRRLGDLLVEAGIISRAQLDEIFARAALVGEGRVVAELHAYALAHERKVAEVLAKKLGAPVAVLSESVIDLGLVRRVPMSLLKEHRAIPIAADERSITLVAVDPDAPGLAVALAFATGRRVVALCGIEAIVASAFDDVVARAAAGERLWIGPHGMGGQPHAAVARFAPAVGIAEANAIAKQIVAALEDPPSGSHASMPIGAVRLKQVVVERPTVIGTPIEPPAPAPASDGTVSIDDVPPPGDASEPVVMIVDDDDDIRLLLTRAFEHDGAVVIQARTGDEAVTLLRLMRPSVIVLDAMLPMVHGFEICAAIKRSQLKDLPVIMISAVYRGVDQAREIQETHGADYFIAKPFELTYVRKLVAELLRRPHANVPQPQLVTRLIDDARASYADHAAHGLFMAAEADVQLWISLDPFDGRAWLERGNLHSLAGDLVSAMSAYEAAVVYDPKLLIAHLGLAMSYEELGFAKRARSTWLKARELAPDAVIRATIDKHLG